MSKDLGSRSNKLDQEEKFKLPDNNNNNILSFNEYLKLFELMKKTVQNKKTIDDKHLKSEKESEEVAKKNIAPPYFPTIEYQQLQINENSKIDKNMPDDKMIQPKKSERGNYRNYYHYNEHPFIDTRGKEVILTSGELESVPFPSSIQLNVLCYYAS